MQRSRQRSIIGRSAASPPGLKTPQTCARMSLSCAGGRAIGHVLIWGGKRNADLLFSVYDDSQCFWYQFLLLGREVLNDMVIADSKREGDEGRTHWQPG